jgi:hypothetical protein
MKSKYKQMKQQEIITIISNIPKNLHGEQSVVNTYPELQEFFEKGMYVESIVQSCLVDGRFVITFVLRYYNASQQ